MASTAQAWSSRNARCHVFGYHSDTVALGAMTERAGVVHLVLTHLIPPPVPPDRVGAEAFAADVREGGYTGALTVGRNLTTVTSARTRARA